MISPRSEPQVQVSALNSVLASVNGEPISLEDVLPLTRAAEYQAAAAYSGGQLNKAVYEIRKRAVESLIDRKLIVADYKKQEFVLPSRDIEAELDAVAERMGYRSRSEFIRKLRENGSSIDEIRREVEERIICQLMLYRAYQTAAFITPRDVHEYYTSHREEFASPESIELAMLSINPGQDTADQKISEIQAALDKNPDRFAELVKRHSTGPAAERGGDLGTIELKRLRPEFAAAIVKPETGRVYGPIKTPEGLIWLRINAYHPSKDADFTSLEPQIRQRLEAVVRAESAKRYTDRLREGAIIRYFFEKN